MEKQACGMLVSKGLELQPTAVPAVRLIRVLRCKTRLRLGRDLAYGERTLHSMLLDSDSDWRRGGTWINGNLGCRPWWICCAAAVSSDRITRIHCG